MAVRKDIYYLDPAVETARALENKVRRKSASCGSLEPNARYNRKVRPGGHGVNLRDMAGLKQRA